MTRRFSFMHLTALLLILSISACGNSDFAWQGDVIKQKRSVADFSKLETNGGFEIELRQGNENNLEIEAPERYIDDLITEVRGNTLVIEMRENVDVNNFKHFKIWLTFKTLNTLIANGAADIQAKSSLELATLSIEINGAANVELPVESQYLESVINGAGNLEFEGNATEAKFRLSGAGNVEALDLEVKKMDISLSGAGSAKVFVTGHLDASISGMGSIRYKGNPTVNKTDGSLFGSIKPY